MANLEIRKMAKENGISLWMIADRLGISEPTMTRLMRKELSEPKRQEIIDVINDLSEVKV